MGASTDPCNSLVHNAAVTTSSADAAKTLDEYCKLLPQVLRILAMKRPGFG